MTERRRRGLFNRKSESKEGGCTWKRGPRHGRPLFDGRGQLTVSCRPSSSRPWLSSPLSVIPPFTWVTCESALEIASVAAAWHAHPTPALCAPGHLPPHRETRCQAE